MNRRRWRPAVLLMMATVCAACTFLRPSEMLTMRGAHGEAVRAVGYAPRYGTPQGAAFDDLDIDLREAPAFIVVLPDGYRANSKTISTELLIEHSFKLETTRGFTTADSTIPFVPPDANRRVYFVIGQDGGVAEVHLLSCGRHVKDALGTSDGSRSFDLPMTQQDLEELFGLTAKVERVYALAAFTC